MKHSMMRLAVGFAVGLLLLTQPAPASAQEQKISKPCLHKPEYRQFDFWVGEWDVKNPQGQVVGTNSVQRVVDGCLLLENWTGAGGVVGKSVNFFNAETGKWRQTWVGSMGGVLQLDGEYKDGAMRYAGVTTDREGRKTLERLTFFNLGPDRVRQLWEQSKDAGKTWSIAFDGDYVRKNAPVESQKKEERQDD